VWDDECELIEKIDFEPAKDWGANPSKKGFQVSTDTSERKCTKVRKGDVHCLQGIQQLPLNITVGEGRVETNHEHLQLKHM
jgi:hypothetical protein